MTLFRQPYIFMAIANVALVVAAASFFLRLSRLSKKVL